jgi:cation transport protein ChaC
MSEPSNHLINRDTITHDPHGILKQMRETALAQGIIVLSEAEQEVLRQKMLSELPSGQDFWIFAYGSLIWNPSLSFVETRTALLHGWHRDFCIHLPFNRGTPENPGLMMGLQEGGQCLGKVYRIAKEEVDYESQLYFRREMNTDIYMPTWLDVETPEGIIKAVALIVNTQSCRYRIVNDMEEKARTIAQAKGPVGSNREYLFNTLAALEELNIHDPLLETLAERINLLC